MDSQGSYISKILYVKMKESGPLGGMCRACPLDSPMHGTRSFGQIRLISYICLLEKNFGISHMLIFVVHVLFCCLHLSAQPGDRVQICLKNQSWM